MLITSRRARVDATIDGRSHERLGRLAINDLAELDPPSCASLISAEPSPALRLPPARRGRGDTGRRPEGTMVATGNREEPGTAAATA